MQALCFALRLFIHPLHSAQNDTKRWGWFNFITSNLAKYPLRVILSVVETRGGLRRVEDSEGEPFCERLGSKKRLSIALVTVSYILRAVCGDNASLARLMVYLIRLVLG